MNPMPAMLAAIATLLFPISQQALPPYGLRGTVLDAQGKPVEGADVALLRLGRPRSTAKVDGEGRFTLHADSLGPEAKLEVLSTHHGPLWIRDLPSIPGMADLGPIVLESPATLRGRVLDPGGKGVAGASLFVTPSVDERHEPLAVSGPDGSFEIEFLPRAEVAVGISAAGFADLLSRKVSLLAGGTSRAEFRLEPEEAFEGTVVDGASTPVPGAIVTALRREAIEPLLHATAVTGAEGRFVLRGMGKGGPFELSISKMGHAPVKGDRASLPADRRWTLAPAPVVAVRAEGAGSPIASVRFEVYTRSGEGWRRQDGEAEPDEPAGPDLWRVTLPSAGRARFTVTTEDGRTAQTGDVEVPASGAAEARAVFEAEGTLSGRVKSPDGAPAAGVPVLLHLGGLPSRSVESGPDGSFFFSHVPPGAHTLEARAPERVSDPVPATLTSGGRTEGIEIALKKAARITGRLTFDGSAPGRETPMGAFQFERVRGAPPGVREGKWTLVALALASASGDFSLAPVPPGRIAVVPKRPSDPESGAVRSFLGEFPEPEEAKGIVRVKPEEEARLDLDLPALRPSAVEGAVRVNGKERAGVRVTLAPAAGGRAMDAITDEAGKFRIRLDRGGEFDLRLTLPGFDASRRTSVPGGSTAAVPFDLEAGSIRGAVGDRNGNPVSLRVRLERPLPPPAERHPAFGKEDVEPWEEALAGLSGADGTFAFREAEAGTYRVLVHDVETRFAFAASDPFEVRPGPEVAVPPILVPREAPLRVTVKGPEGKPPFASVRLLAAPGAPPLPRRFFQWTGDGSIVVHGLPPGPLLVQLHTYGPWEAPEQRITLPEDGNETALVFEVKKKE